MGDFNVGKTRAVDYSAITAAITIISSLWYLQVLPGCVTRWESGSVFLFSPLMC